MIPITPSATGYSERIDDAARRPCRELRTSTLGHRESLEELWDVWQECRQPNWDGYDAIPVEQDTYSATYELIESFPLGFPRPSIGAEPDGQLTLEWHNSPWRTLSVSVDPSGYLHYAGLFGPNKRYGTLTFFSCVPEELLRLIRDL